MSQEPLLFVREARAEDLEAIASIQAAATGAAQWEARDYLAYDCLVAEYGGRIAGFAVARRTADAPGGESELLNLAVQPILCRRGIGRRLLAEIAARHPGTVWLEVRESNLTARKFYKTFGFCEAGKRYDYYENSREAAIVMNFHS